MTHSAQKMRRLDSSKLHSWIWDSHISPINSKRLAENLEEMDQSVKRMLNVIKEDGVSFAKKAEIYFQKRPELEGHVEQFYRRYRALAEHCENLTGELRNSLPTDLRSQESGISGGGSELRTRAAGFLRSAELVSVDNGEIKLKSANSKIEALEEELKIRNDKRQHSEEEIASLKHGLENNEIVLATNIVLRYQLESAKKRIEMEEAELELEKKYILDLEEQIRKWEVDAHKNFPLEKSQLLEKISLASESQARLEEVLKSLESKARCLEKEIKRVETEETENKHLQAIHEAGMQSKIEQLKADIARRSNQMELTNKNFDALELKYDMLVAEKDQLNAKVLTLKAEGSSRDDRIRQMGEDLHRLHVELTSGSERASKLEEELKARSKTLEGELEAEKIVVLNGAEEKREVIRQLCFSLEHYRDRYQRLRQAFLVHKRPAILAS